LLTRLPQDIFDFATFSLIFEPDVMVLWRARLLRKTKMIWVLCKKEGDLGDN